MRAIIIILGCLIVAASCSREQTPAERAGELAAASLKMVRLEQQAAADGNDPASALGQAESDFLKVVEFPPESVGYWVITGKGGHSERIEKFLETTRGLPSAGSGDDPAAVIMDLLSGIPETKGKDLDLLEGYAAAFQMCLELERDGTVIQDFIPFLAALGCPLTFRDLGLEGAGRPRLEELAAEASGRTGKRTYSTGPFDYFITMVKLDSWGAKFSGQVTADSLASKLLKNPEMKKTLIALAGLPELKLGFLGDSNMDRIHWSTQAPFPDIVAALMLNLNPRVTVVNAGKGGDDSGEALARVEEDLLKEKPDISFVMLGGNDCRHRGGPNPAVTPQQYRKNIIEITERLRQGGSRVALLSYPRFPELSGADLEVFQAINVELKAAAKSLETGYLDIFSLLAVKDQREVYAVDRIHLNPTAHLLIAARILEWLAAVKTEKPGG